jgi:hypothetical protein
MNIDDLNPEINPEIRKVASAAEGCTICLSGDSAPYL